MRVLVVGAGPAGSLSAINLKGFEVTVVEEHQSSGFPVQCAGLISEDCYKVIRRYSDCKVKEVRGMVLFSPSGRYVELEGKSRGVVVERKIMDRDLLAKASESCDVLMKTKFIRASNGRALVKRMGETMELEYDCIIGADGVYSAVARCFGFERPKIATAVQVEVRYEAHSDDLVELYFGREFSNGFFAYAIPIDSTARVGVISFDNAMYYLKRFLRRNGRVKSESPLELNVGAIPIGLVEFVKGKVVLIGDSAGMVKPYTGGGLYYISKATSILGRTFPDLSRFKRDFMREIGREIGFGMKVLNLYSKLTDSDYDYLIEVANRFKHLSTRLHMDRPTTLLSILPAIRDLIRRPGLLKKILATLAF